MLYLGTVDGMPYVIGAVEQLEGMDVHSVIVSDLSTRLGYITTALAIPAGNMTVPSEPVPPGA